MIRNKEKINARKRQNKKDNPDWKHREKKREKNKICRSKNKEHIKKKYDEWKEKNEGYLKEYFRKYNKDIRDPVEQAAYRRRYTLLSKYDLTVEEYEKILESQNGVCAICKQPPKPGKNLNVDHDHKLAKILKKQGKSIKESVRGLLDYNCNRRLISNLADRDNAVELFEGALNYIKKHREKNYEHIYAKKEEDKIC